LMRATKKRSLTTATALIDIYPQHAWGVLTADEMAGATRASVNIHPQHACGMLTVGEMVGATR
jgi:hypothetical protein